MAACPAAVAATLFLFLSASVMKSQLIDDHIDIWAHTSFLLSFNLLHDIFDFCKVKILGIGMLKKRLSHLNASAYHNFAIPVQHTDLDILGPRLYDLKQTFDSQFNRIFARHVVLVVFLKELAHSFR